MSASLLLTAFLTVVLRGGLCVCVWAWLVRGTRRRMNKARSRVHLIAVSLRALANCCSKVMDVQHLTYHCTATSGLRGPKARQRRLAAMLHPQRPLSSISISYSCHRPPVAVVGGCMSL